MNTAVPGAYRDAGRDVEVLLLKTLFWLQRRAVLGQRQITRSVPSHQSRQPPLVALGVEETAM